MQAQKPLVEETSEDQADQIFAAVSSAFDTYREAEAAVMILYVPDLSFKRDAICMAIKKLKDHYAG